MIDRQTFDAYAAKQGLMEARTPCFVYLMRCDRFIKVGISGDVEKRRASLQRTNPFEVTVAKKYAFGDRPFALRAEQGAHKRLTEFRVWGEWFDVPFETAAAAVQEEADAARKAMRSETLELQKRYAALWNQYIRDKEFQREVNDHDLRDLEAKRKYTLQTRALSEFEAAYRNGEYDKGRVA